MTRKRINRSDLDETVGPMNNVASEDAFVYAHADPNRPLDVKKEREIRAKKKKIKQSSKKADRRINKAILRMDINDDDEQ